MAEGLQTPDGQKVEVTEQDFARAMAAPEPDEPVAAAPPRKDPEAPYGRTKDGQPKRGPGGRPARYDAPRAAKTAPAPVTETPLQADKRRNDGIKGLVQMASAGTLIMHQRTGSDAFLADTLTLTASAEPLADAVAETCKVNASFAKLVDRVTSVGPYGVLISVGIGITAQLAANHGLGIGRLLGGRDPADIIAAWNRENEPQDIADASPAHTAN